MKRQRREHGRILSVETKTRGSALADDYAAGVTTISVDDAGDFDEDGGWLYIGAQTIAYTEVDDDTGAITLADPLAAAGEQGDPVHVWSDLYAEVVDYQEALVELDGEYDNPDPVIAEVAEGVGELPEGDRGKAGESCTLHRVADDEWEVVGVGGRAAKSRSIRFEQDDAYTLTSDDVSAGTATLTLTHRPIDEALTCVLAGVPQRPTEWTINYDAQTLTIPLDGWEKAGDQAWVHYAYRKGINTPPAASAAEYVGATSAVGSITSIALPEGVEAGDTLILGSAAWASTSCADPRMTLDQTLPGQTITLGHIWIGTADASGDPIAVTADAAGTAGAGTVLVAVRGPIAASQVLSDAAPVDTATPTAPQISDTKLAVAIALERTGSFSTGSISHTGGYGDVAYAADTKVFADAAIWESSIAATSPADTYTFTGSVDGLAIVVYKIGAGA